MFQRGLDKNAWRNLLWLMMGDLGFMKETAQPAADDFAESSPGSYDRS